jgi:two-component system, chemotaxis family, chemotaxis protein CheY
VKTLIVEDDFTSRVILQRLLQPYGEVHVAVSGHEALQAFEGAWRRGEPYQLICLDVSLESGPDGEAKDGREVLRRVRAFEQEHLVTAAQTAKVVMTTAAGDSKSIVSAFSDSCDGYLVKPFHVERLRALLGEFKLA